MKSTIYIFKYLRGAIFGLALLSVGFTPPLMQNAAAATSFVYNPVQYSAVDSLDFTLSDNPSGAFTTFANLLPSLTYNLGLLDFSFFSFTDGAINFPFTYSSLLSNTTIVTFDVTTNGVGDITGWLIKLTDNVTSTNSLVLESQPPTTGNGQLASHDALSTGAFSEASGTWTTTPVPELSTSLGGLLSVVLLGGMLMRSRGKA